MSEGESTGKRVALVTGAALRIGAAIARKLHADGLDVLVNYHRSEAPAAALVSELNSVRPASALAIAADVRDPFACERLATSAARWQGRLDVLVNNASTFYPTPAGSATNGQWEDLLGTNLKGPFFLSQACIAALQERSGSIVNIADIHALRTLADHPIYTAAKAGLISLTRSLARDLAPEIRVNAIAPGSILWPADGNPQAEAAASLARIPMQRMGDPAQVADAVAYFIAPGSYVTGQLLSIDGGASLV